MNLPGYNAASAAPKVADGLQILRFDDVVFAPARFKPGTDKFGHADNGDRFEFQFTLLDKDGAVQYNEGDEITLDALTRTATGEKSNFWALLSGIMTAAEQQAYKEATAENPFDGDVLKGRIVYGKITHSEKGWPQIDSIVGIVPGK
jgi:hypothetical protein